MRADVRRSTLTNWFLGWEMWDPSSNEKIAYVAWYAVGMGGEKIFGANDSVSGEHQ